LGIGMDTLGCVLFDSTVQREYIYTPRLFEESIFAVF